MMQQLYPEIVVESKKNNSELVKAVQKLPDDENKYIIVFDNSFDNLQALMEQRRLREYAACKPNVILLDIICFEYILLEFRDLIDWIYAPDDEFLEKKYKAIFAREKLLECISSGAADYTILKEIVELNDVFFNHNTASLLDEKATHIIPTIDHSTMISKYRMRSRFDDIVLDIDQLSTGCKTILNVCYFPNKVFCLKECGDMHFVFFISLAMDTCTVAIR